MTAIRRLHITGASGSGVTTLGRSLADRLAAPHHDTDDYYWLPTDPPYREKRPIAARLAMMEAMFLPRPDWVLSGSLDGWGDPLIPHFDAVIFVRTCSEVRMERLRRREIGRYGEDAVKPGGTHHRAFETFLDWASHYDDGSRAGRHLARHEAWLQTMDCPVIRVDGEGEIADLGDDILDQLGLPR